MKTCRFVWRIPVAHYHTMRDPDFRAVTPVMREDAAMPGQSTCLWTFRWGILSRWLHNEPGPGRAGNTPNQWLLNAPDEAQTTFFVWWDKFLGLQDFKRVWEVLERICDRPLSLRVGGYFIIFQWSICHPYSKLIISELCVTVNPAISRENYFPMQGIDGKTCRNCPQIRIFVTCQYPSIH